MPNTSRPDPLEEATTGFIQALAEAWGSSLQRARRNQGLSQKELAALAGLTQQTVSKAENGTVFLSDRNKFRLACALSTSVADVFAWPDAAQQVVLMPE